MIKFGVHSLAQLSHGVPRSGLFGGRRFVAATLYPEIAASDRPDRERLLEEILLWLPNANATYKRTHAARFEEFDRAFVELLRAAPPGRQLEIHDIAISDGRTAVDFFERFSAIDGLDFHFRGTDYSPEVVALEVPAGALRVIVDPIADEIVQIVRPPFVFNVALAENPVFYPVNAVLLRWLVAGPARRLHQRYRDGDPLVRSTSIALLHPRCLALMEADSRFELGRYDILSPAERKFDVVRAMNVLNHNYFSDDLMARAVANVRACLNPGGFFLTGSNQDAGTVVDGAIYRRTEQGFDRLYQSGAGSVVDAHVLS